MEHRYFPRSPVTLAAELSTPECVFKGITRDLSFEGACVELDGPAPRPAGAAPASRALSLPALPAENDVVELRLAEPGNRGSHTFKAVVVHTRPRRAGLLLFDAEEPGWRFVREQCRAASRRLRARGAVTPAAHPRERDQRTTKAGQLRS